MRDPHAERDLTGFLPKGVHVFPVGRLDRDTEGLLLLTNDGSLAHRLTHPRYAIEKEYLAEVGRPPSNRQLSRLRRGVELDDGTARPSTLVRRECGGAGERRWGPTGDGRGPQARGPRMLDAVELPVRRLVRVRSGRSGSGKLRPGESASSNPRTSGRSYRAPVSDRRAEPFVTAASPACSLSPTSVRWRRGGRGQGSSGARGDPRRRGLRPTSVLSATERLLPRCSNATRSAPTTS
jgi:pseudouridine synthase